MGCGKERDDWGGGIVVSDQKPVVEGDVWVCVLCLCVLCSCVLVDAPAKSVNG